jgi:hypothetical protein
MTPTLEKVLFRRCRLRRSGAVFVIGLAAGLSGGASAAEAAKESAATPKSSTTHGPSPLVNLGLEISGCSYIVHVNGGLVSLNLMDTGANETTPINHWLRSGLNELNIQIYRFPEAKDRPDTCSIKSSVTVGDNRTPEAEPATALTLVYSTKADREHEPFRGSSPTGRFDSRQGYRASPTGDLQVQPPQSAQLTGRASLVQSLTRTFAMELPFPEWAFFKGDKLKQWWEYKDDKDEKPTYHQIEAAYEKLHKLLVKKDITGFLDACEERSREADLAYYRKPGETREKLKDRLKSAVNDRSLQLIDVLLKPGDTAWRYTVGTTGQVIGLTLGRIGAPILRFEKKDDTPFSLVFPVFFRKEGDRFIVTR